jgi:ribonuclease-3
MKETDELLRTLDYRFNNDDLLMRALTHSSYASEHRLGYEHNNERLEFIGDAYVDAVIGDKLFQIMEKAHEGMLSRSRADVVCEASLAETARRISLGDYIRLGKGEASSGGRDKDSILADCFEALMGAIILDGGFEAGRRVILDLLGYKIELAVEGKLNKDYKTRLQEKLQEADHMPRIRYIIVKEEGPDHNKLFTVNLEVNKIVVGTGTGRSKAKAEQAAAGDALSRGIL